MCYKLKSTEKLIRDVISSPLLIYSPANIQPLLISEGKVILWAVNYMCVGNTGVQRTTYVCRTRRCGVTCCSSLPVQGITYDTGGADIKAGGVMAGMHRCALYIILCTCSTYIWTYICTYVHTRSTVCTLV